jgi:hypothetical protein|tara:strand:+ start:1187 stop:1594 length:408 start_codon:yes stop_codon:yes gene_type:complete
MGLDMNVYATNGENLTQEDLYEEDGLWVDLNSWYWRKANAVHNWMVENVQEGEDNCGVYEVFLPQLMDLKGIVEKIIANPSKAADLLPTASGFFFGSQEYDEWYMDDMHLTLTNINQMLDEAAMGETRFFYTSSW